MTSNNLVQQQRILYEVVAETCARRSVRAFMVGGVVRDLFLTQRISERDLDFIIEGPAEAVAKDCAERLSGGLRTFPDFLTAKIEHPAKLPAIFEVDFASARKEVYEKPGALPKVNAAAIEEDLGRRDFSINAVALPLDAVIAWSSGRLDLAGVKDTAIDPFQGLKCLQERRIEVLHDRSFVDDPTRLYRACRYLVRIDGRFGEKTETLAKDAAAMQALCNISTVRRFNEFKKIMGEKEWLRCLELAESLMLLEPLELRFDAGAKMQLAKLNERFLKAGVNEQGLMATAVVCMFLGSAGQPAREAWFLRHSYSKKKIKEIEEAVAQGKRKDRAGHNSPLAKLLYPL